MIYLVIALIVGLALAPLSHFVPSRRQRHQASLRESAALKGLFVEFRRLPQSGAGTAAVAGSNVIYYGLRLKPSRGKVRRQGVWLRDEQGWRSVGPRLPVPQVLQDMPAAVLAASVDDASCGVYWQEAGDPSTVAQIRENLGDWSEQLQA